MPRLSLEQFELMQPEEQMTYLYRRIEETAFAVDVSLNYSRELAHVFVSIDKLKHIDQQYDELRAGKYMEPTQE